MSPVQVLLQAENLRVTRGNVKVLDVPSFALREKEVLALIGPNGAGKSTLLLALARLIPLSNGTLSYRGSVVRSDREVFAYRRRLAMVFQESLLFDSTVFENVAAGLRIRGMAKREIAERVEETLELFRMTHLSRRSARRLSGGEAQRTSLARAFAIRPEIIFLDEPFAALDPPTRTALTDDLERILREKGTAAIIATHDQIEALRMSDRMAVVAEGGIIQTGPPADVMTRPANEFVASFIGMENVLTAAVETCSDGMVAVALAGQMIEFPGSAAPGDAAVFCVRPEHITVATSEMKTGTSARNVFGARITRIVTMGPYEKLYLDCGFPLVAYLTHQSLGDLHLRAGQDVYASFKATAVHVMRTGKPQKD